MLTNPLPHNQNMNSRTHDQSSGDQDLPEGSGHGCINMVRARKVVIRAEDYGSSQPNPGKEPDPPGTPLRIEKPVDKPETAPRIPKGVLKHLGHNPNAKSPRTILLSIIWAKLLVRCPHLKYFRVVLHKGKPCFLLLELMMITLLQSSNLKPWDYSLTCLTMCLS